MGCPRRAAFVVILIAVGFYTHRVKSRWRWVMLASCILQFIPLFVMILFSQIWGFKWVQCSMFS